MPAGGKPKSKAPLFIILGALAGLIVVGLVIGLVVVPALSGDDDDEARVTTTTQADDEESTTTEADDETTTTEGGDEQPSGSDLPDGQTAPSFDDAGFDALGESCLDGDMAACDILYAVTPIDSVAEAYGATCGGRNDQIPGECVVEYDWALPDAQAPGSLGSDSTFDALTSDCESGDLQACDDLFGQTPVGSDYEAYGRTCGGRLPAAAAEVIPGFSCVSRYGEAS